MRVAGIYELWERKKVFENEISILKDTRQKLEEAYDSLKPDSEFITSQGKIIKFEFAGNWKEIKEDIKVKLDDINEVLPLAESELETINDKLKEKEYERILADFTKDS